MVSLSASFGFVARVATLWGLSMRDWYSLGLESDDESRGDDRRSAFDPLLLKKTRYRGHGWGIYGWILLADSVLLPKRVYLYPLLVVSCSPRARGGDVQVRLG